MLLASAPTSLFASTNPENEATNVAQQAKHTVKGTVKDTNGEPLVGVMVRVAGTSASSASAVSDIDGNYSVTVPIGVQICGL